MLRRKRAHQFIGHFRRSDVTNTFVTKVSKLKLAEVVSIGWYHITDDFHEELRKLSQEGMSVKIEHLASIPMELVDL